MPRPGQVKSSSDERLPDRIAIGVLTRAFPPELVDEVVVGCGRVEQRQRLLPARVVVYFVLICRTHSYCGHLGGIARHGPAATPPGSQTRDRRTNRACAPGAFGRLQHVRGSHRRVPALADQAGMDQEGSRAHGRAIHRHEGRMRPGVHGGTKRALGAPTPTRTRVSPERCTRLSSRHYQD
ncbi:transposase domain-containing protein [Streptomyces sp. NPDC005318]|uniref:transposase domain-containing protein n=1 Tax=Streptomyces sp. NPDC005318 TaxID=3157031 RepID=UPI0033B75BF2